MTGFVIKRGDSLDLECHAADEDDAPVSLTGWTLRSQIRSPTRGLLLIFSVDVTDPENGVFHLIATPAETSDLPIGQARMDIEYTDVDGIVQSTETIPIVIDGDITR